MDEATKELLINKIYSIESEWNNLTEKSLTKGLREIFTPLLLIEGFKHNKDSMRRHGYDFIASTYKKKETIAVLHKREESLITKDEIEDIVAGGTIDGFSKIICFTNAKLTSGADQYDIDLYPVIFEKMYIPSLKNWVAKIEADYDETEVAKILRTCTQKLIEVIAKNPNGLEEMEWRDLERIIAELFRGLGFKVELTPPAKDGGKDIIIEFNDERKNKSYIIEIKHWRSRQKVGQNFLKDFIKVVASEKRNGGLFLSTYGFVENAIESLTEIERQKVKFGKEEKIHSLCRTYIKRKSGLWMKDKTLTQILYEDTQ